MLRGNTGFVISFSVLLVDQDPFIEQISVILDVRLPL